MWCGLCVVNPIRDRKYTLNIPNFNDKEKEESEKIDVSNSGDERIVIKWENKKNGEGV
jgi:hypothetical protein